MIDHLFVYLDLSPGGARLTGEIFFSAKGGKLVSSTFRYDTGYLAWAGAFPIDPELGLHTGAQNVTRMPGALQDCAPDRWGRNLITKERRVAALAEGRRASTLTDADFLIGVSDFTRQGALRFRAVEDGAFLSEGIEVPKLIELPRLLHAAEAVCLGDDFGAIKALLDAGSGSLGGARPKASVRDGEQLLIAKFPHPDDEWDVMAWEKTALDLAALAGIRVPATRLAHVDDHSVLLLDRFDRRQLARVPYVSAMTLLSARDGDSHDYAEVAEALPEVSAATRADLNELWRRVAFSVLVNNTDDHLRNHGFLHESGGWRLSPAFDLNPNPDTGTPRQTGVGGAYEREAALAALHEYAKDFDLTPVKERQILDEVTTAVSRWRDAASANGVSTKDLELFADAFWIPQ
ncbi:MAG TPA: HipA domain-containing protein [Acidothermaceae bacterium]